MSQTKAERIEAVNGKIVTLMLDRKKVRRHGTWAQEEAITAEINKLEQEIKAIREEQ